MIPHPQITIVFTQRDFPEISNAMATRNFFPPLSRARSHKYFLVMFGFSDRVGSTTLKCFKIALHYEEATVCGGFV